MPLAEQFHQAVAAARNTDALDNTARLLWRAHAEGQIADAEAVAGAVQARRAAFSRPAAGVALAAAAPASARRRPARPRSPDRQASLERRRRCAASGALPPQLAAAFTTAEIATLSIIALEVRKAGACTLCVDAIAARAGVSRSSVGNAIRLAERLGFLQRIERRHAGQRSETNILRVTSREWKAWLSMSGKGGALKNLRPTDIKSLPMWKAARHSAKCWRTMTKSGKVTPTEIKGGARNFERDANMQIELEAGFIGVRELANKLAISTRSVWRFIERKELGVVRVGRRTLVAKAEVARWLAGRQVLTPGPMTNAARQLAHR